MSGICKETVWGTEMEKSPVLTVWVMGAEYINMFKMTESRECRPSFYYSNLHVFLYESGITMLLYSVLYHCVQIILDFRLLDISQHPCCELQGLITCCF